MTAWRLGLAVVATTVTAAHSPIIGAAAATVASPPTSTFRLLQAQRPAQCEQLDFNDSGGVDVADLLLCLGAFGQPTDGPGAQFAVSGGPAVSRSERSSARPRCLRLELQRRWRRAVRWRRLGRLRLRDHGGLVIERWRVHQRRAHLRQRSRPLRGAAGSAATAGAATTRRR